MLQVSPWCVFFLCLVQCFYYAHSVTNSSRITIWQHKNTQMRYASRYSEIIWHLRKGRDLNVASLIILLISEAEGTGCFKKILIFCFVKIEPGGND